MSWSVADVEIHPVTRSDSPSVADVRKLFRAYAEELGVDLCFQGFDDELETLPGKYAPPAGRLFLAYLNLEAVGCAAFRPSDVGVCEMKRFYVAPDFRQRGIASTLLDRTLETARREKYRVARLDTLARLGPALKFYLSQGFVECEAYYANPEPDALFLQRAIMPNVDPAIERYVDYTGRLTQWPSAKGNSQVRPALIAHLAAKFEVNEVLSEAEVNQRLNEWHLFDDPAFLRRELIDTGWMIRDAYGKAYRRTAPVEVQ